MLTCKDMTTEAHNLLDGELGLWRRIQIKFHLLMCKYCRRFVRQLSLTVDTLKDVDSLDEEQCAPTEDQVDAMVERLKQRK